MQFDSFSDDISVFYYLKQQKAPGLYVKKIIDIYP
jgi:hypothetical protein